MVAQLHDGTAGVQASQRSKPTNTGTFHMKRISWIHIVFLIVYSHENWFFSWESGGSADLAGIGSVDTRFFYICVLRKRRHHLGTSETYKILFIC